MRYAALGHGLLPLMLQYSCSVMEGGVSVVRLKWAGDDELMLPVNI